MSTLTIKLKDEAALNRACIAYGVPEGDRKALAEYLKNQIAAKTADFEGEQAAAAAREAARVKVEAELF